MMWAKVAYTISLAGKTKGYTGLSRESYTMCAKQAPTGVAEQMVSFCITLLEFAVNTGIITEAEAVTQAAKVGQALSNIKFKDGES